jgi:hypothetical protein
VLGGLIDVTHVIGACPDRFETVANRKINRKIPLSIQWR